MYKALERQFNYHWPFYILFFILFAAFVLRFININYNSPFNDEAASILIGKMGIFQRDWWTYNTSSWYAGSPYIYPVLSSLASTYGGIIGSRLLNVIFGVLTVEVIYLITFILTDDSPVKNTVSGLIAATIIAGSVSGIYISRLATYDASSYYFLLSSFYFLLKNKNLQKVTGEFYFFSAALLILACLTKIIVLIYVPFFVMYSFSIAKKKSDSHTKFWLYYFLLPLVLGLGIYMLTSLESLKTYATLNATREKDLLSSMLTTIWISTKYLWVPYFISAIILIFHKRFKLLIWMSVLAFWIVTPHLITQRAMITMEKGTFLIYGFTAPLIGIALSALIFKLKGIPRFVSFFLIAALLDLYLIFSYKEALQFNSKWANSNGVNRFLTENISNGDKVLVEGGSTSILWGYQKNKPTNYVTFDWFLYKGKSGSDAYRQAIRDGYFNYIELEGIGQQGSTIFSDLHNMIVEETKDNYKLAYSYNGFVVYKRTF